MLGLQWQDFDREDGYLHVRRQWCRDSSYGPPKTLAGVRSIPLPPDLQGELAALRLASSYSGESDPIFASPDRDAADAPQRHTPRLRGRT